MKKTKVLIVDDHSIVRLGLASLLSTEQAIEVVGSVGSGADAISSARHLKPDVVLMDLMMPKMDGAEATSALISGNPNCKVLIITTFSTANGIGAALSAGAKGAVLKSIGFKELVDAILRVSRGERYISPELEQILGDEKPIPELSPRQGEILSLVSQGMTNDAIANRLGISIPMVRQHLDALFHKIGASNRAEAVAIALRKHLLKI